MPRSRLQFRLMTLAVLTGVVALVLAIASCFLAKPTTIVFKSIRPDKDSGSWISYYSTTGEFTGTTYLEKEFSVEDHQALIGKRLTVSFDDRFFGKSDIPFLKLEDEVRIFVSHILEEEKDRLDAAQ